MLGERRNNSSARGILLGEPESGIQKVAAEKMEEPSIESENIEASRIKKETLSKPIEQKASNRDESRGKGAQAEKKNRNTGRKKAGNQKEELEQEDCMQDEGGSSSRKRLDKIGKDTGGYEGEEEFPGKEKDEVSSGSRRKQGALRSGELFFSAEKADRDFADVLREIQGYLSKEYSDLVAADGSEEVRTQIRRFAGKYIQEHRISVKGMSTDELLDAVYSEMTEYGFLTKYIYGEGIEEIDINAWDDVEIQYSGGGTKKLEEHFTSPEHAINVVRRMLHVSGMVLDDASPCVLGHLSKNIRIAVLKTPVLDEDVGVAASIRIVNPQNVKKEDFIRGGTASDEMLDFLSECIRYGISVCVAGATSSGKTTLMGWLLTTIPDGKRIYSIENGSRELALVRRKEGRVVNSVIHTLTRDSENERQRVDQITLLDMALRFNPDIIVVGEMRGPEANAAQEAARTGVAVVTTIHSMSCDATYRRMVSLCKRAVDMSDETLMGFVTEAYPIVAFCKQLENRERRLMEIMECEIRPDGARVFRPLFQYQIRENRVENGKFIITGSHKKINPISEGLARRFLENGMPQEMIRKFLMEAENGKEVQEV